MANANKKYMLSARLTPELGEKIEFYANKLFEGNRTDLVRNAIKLYIDSLQDSPQEKPMNDNPRLKRAISIARYIRLIVLHGHDANDVLKKEVSTLCQILGEKTVSYE